MIPIKYTYFEFTLDILVVGGENNSTTLTATLHPTAGGRLQLGILVGVSLRKF